MPDILFARFFCSGAGAGIVIALRKSQATLVGFSDDRSSVFKVLVGTVAEECISIYGMQVGQQTGKVRFGFKRIDAVQFRLNRSNAFAFNRSFIHAGGVEVANLLLNGAAVRTFSSGFLQDVAQDEAVAFSQFGVTSIGGLVAGHGILLEPSSTGILVEITAGIGDLVHQCCIEAF